MRKTNTQPDVPVAVLVSLLIILCVSLGAPASASAQDQYKFNDSHIRKLEALWTDNGFRELHVERYFNGSSGSVAVQDGVWYLFLRESWFAPTPVYCQGADYSRTVVYYSYDQGQNWYGPQVVASPEPGSASACSVLDGGAFYDEQQGTWHLLSQFSRRTRDAVADLPLHEAVPHSVGGVRF